MILPWYYTYMEFAVPGEDKKRRDKITALGNIGYSVLAIDYRGFGDSTQVEVTESTQVKDAMAALRYLKKMRPRYKTIIVWGHSHGGAVAVQLAAKVARRNIRRQYKPKRVYRLVLESTYTRMEDATTASFQDSPLSAIIPIFPIASWIKAANIEFKSDDTLPSVVWPTLCLHARNDTRVDFSLGEKLYKKAVDNGKEDIRLVTFGERLEYGHSHIYKYPGFGGLINNFINEGVTNPNVCDINMDTDTCV